MRNKVIILFALYAVACTRTQPDAYYFCGDIVSIHSDSIPITAIHSDLVHLDDIYAGYMSAYDSLLIFVHPAFREKYMYVFNTKTNHVVGKFLQKGQGPDDYYSFTHTEQFEYDGADLKLWGRDAIRGKIVLLNLSRSLSENEVVIDSVIKLEWKDKFQTPFICVYLRGDKIIASTQPQMKPPTNNRENLADYIPEQYHQFDTADVLLKTYSIYKNPIMPKQQTISAHNYYYSQDRIKPDGSKICISMAMLAQINILDLNTERVTGYRLANTPCFSDLTVLPEKYKFYYIQNRVDDQFIYALYANVPLDFDKFPFNDYRI
jgi:hypothetical protein